MIPLRPAARRLAKLLAAIGPARRILILTHDNPDPDALASAWALHSLLSRRRGREIHVGYGGLIGRPANRAMVSVLKFPIIPIEGLDLERYERFALVDSQPETGNNSLPADRVPDVVLDHHPLRDETRAARYFDVRPKLGATATLVGEYLDTARLRIDKRLATALFFALKSETLDLSRQTGPRDVALYTRLFRLVDREALSRIERAPVSRNYLEWLKTAIAGTTMDGTLALANLGALDYPDRVAEFADIAIQLEGLEWVLVLGRYEEALYLSVRTTRDAGAGRMIRKIVGTLGKAGGHGTMAGGKVPITDGRSAEDLEREIIARAREHLA